MLRSFLGSLSALLFPRECLSCEILLETTEGQFCHLCGEELQLIDFTNRCLVCFEEVCKPTCTRRSLFEAKAACFDYYGPAKVLVAELKQGRQINLSKGMAAYLALQFYKLSWPLPDAIVPVPLHWYKKAMRGFNQCELLAQELASLLKCPVMDILKKGGPTPSQAKLPSHQRRITPEYLLKKGGMCLKRKRVLVLDDVMTTGTTLEACGEALFEACPKELYALTFTRA